jgi:hypothetical protein
VRVPGMMYVKERNAPSTWPTAPPFFVIKSPYILSHFGGALMATLVWSAACLSRSIMSSSDHDGQIYNGR